MKQKIDERILDILVCLKCKGNLKYNEPDQLLICEECKIGYRIDEGIPIMLIDEAVEL